MYLTVINKLTKLDVPFERVYTGEIKLLSTNPLDTEENCVVKLTRVFYQYSVDWNHYYERN